MKRMCGVIWTYTGSEATADEVFAPIQEFGPPALHGVQAVPFPAFQSAFDARYPPGVQWYLKADFFKELTDEAIARHVEHGSQLPPMHSTMHLYPIDGAAHRVGADETAWSYRDARWAEVIAGIDPDPANAEAVTDWAQAYWEALHPFSAGGAYINMMMEEGQHRVQASYRDNYPRLVDVKTRYDPTNLFRVNQNIPPAG